MIRNRQSAAAKAFARKWEEKGYEKGESQSFWLELLQTVFEVERPYDIISFENQVKLSSTSFIDAYIGTATESSCVALLLKKYKELTSHKPE